MPKITVIIPLYNKADGIHNAIKSVLNQKFNDWELVIVNDGSTDDSINEVLKFTDERIRMFTQNNAGVSAARNKGVELARGEWIAFLDADDVFYPDWLDFCSGVSINIPTCELVAASYHIETSGVLVEVNPWRQKICVNDVDEKCITAPHTFMTGDFFALSLEKFPPICASGICIKRTTFIKYGGFETNIKCGEDLLLWANLALTTSIIGSKSPMVCYNRSGEIGSAWGTWRGVAMHPNWRAWFDSVKYKFSNVKNSDLGQANSSETARLWMIKMIEDDSRKALLCGDKDGAKMLLFPPIYPINLRYIILIFLCFMPTSISKNIRSIKSMLKEWFQK